MIRRFTALRSRKGLDRSGPLRKRSRAKRAVTIAGLGVRLSRWCRCYGECFKCGMEGVPLEAHHVFTRGSTANLKLCPDNLLPLCRGCHAFAHEEPGRFETWLDHALPGLLSHLSRLSRSKEWRRKDLGEVEALVDALPCYRDYVAWRAL